MSEFRADLHCHSTYSDGTDTPQALIDLAIERGLSGLSITDHDTIAAYHEALPYAKEKNFLLLSGIEFSAYYGNEPVHILGYAFDLASDAIAKLCAHHRKRRTARIKYILLKLSKLGINIDEEELFAMPSGTLGRPHIALLLVKEGYVKSVKEAFQKYLGEGKAAFEPGERISVGQTLGCIREAKGKAVLAHPHLLQRSSVVRALLAMPFDGLEGYYASFSRDQEEKWIRLARERQWLVTGGSDYHGSVKTHNPLGCSWVDQTLFMELYDHFCRTH